MLEKSVGVALMAALVWSSFHFFGEVRNGPPAVVAQLPQWAQAEYVE